MCPVPGNTTSSAWGMPSAMALACLGGVDTPAVAHRDLAVHEEVVEHQAGCFQAGLVGPPAVGHTTLPGVSRQRSGRSHRGAESETATGERCDHRRATGLTGEPNPLVKGRGVASSRNSYRPSAAQASANSSRNQFWPWIIPISTRWMRWTGR